MLVVLIFYNLVSFSYLFISAYYLDLQCPRYFIH